MKLEYLCKLDEWGAELRALSDKIVFYALCEKDRDELRDAGENVPKHFDLALINEAISKIEKEIDPYFGFSNMLYYELEANLMEAPRPEEVANLYKNRFRYSSTLYDAEDVQNHIQNGRLDQKEADKLERSYLMLVGCWELFMEEIHTHITDAIEGFWRKTESTEAVHKVKELKVNRVKNNELTSKEIDGLERLFKNQKDIVFVQKKDDKYIWVYSVKETSMAFFVNCLYPTGRARWKGIENYFGVSNLKSTPFLPKGQISDNPNDWRHAMTVALRQ